MKLRSIRRKEVVLRASAFWVHCCYSQSKQNRWIDAKTVTHRYRHRSTRLRNRLPGCKSRESLGFCVAQMQLSGTWRRAGSRDRCFAWGSSSSSTSPSQLVRGSDVTKFAKNVTGVSGDAVWRTRLKVRCNHVQDKTDKAQSVCVQAGLVPPSSQHPSQRTRPLLQPRWLCTSRHPTYFGIFFWALRSVTP
jgi:hypothetical protein